MKKRLLFFILLFSGSVFSQTDTKPPLNGIQTTYYKNEVKKDVINFKHGKREGQHINYYADGTIHFIANYHNDLFTGELQIFGKQIITRKEYLAAETVLTKDGVDMFCYFYDQYKGAISISASYYKIQDKTITKDYYDVNNRTNLSKLFKINGEEIKYNIRNEITSITLWSLGNKVEETHFCSRLENSFCNPERNILWKTIYAKNESGVKTRLFSSYDEGYLSFQYFYVGEDTDHSVKEYYKDGLLKSAYFVNNEGFQGEYEFYWSNGKLKEKFNYIDGKLTGKQSMFYFSGEKMEECIENDTSVQLIFYHQNGQVREIRNYLKKQVATCFLTQTKEGIIEAKNILADGNWKKFDEKGTLITESIYENGKILK